MRIPFSRLGRLGIVFAFLSGAAAVLVYFFAGTEVRVPGIEPVGYQVLAKSKDVDNLVPASQVRMAGVQIGEVRKTTTTPDGVVIQFAITNKDVAPLHQGVIVRIGARSLVEDSYLDITDGHGPPLPDSSTLPPDAVQTSTQVDDLLRSLDPQTRDNLGSLLRSLGQGTQGTQQGLDATVTGLGELGRNGHTALDAIAAQSEDLQHLGQQTRTLLNALDTGEGQIATLVTEAQKITAATSGQRQSIEDTMRRLPGVLDSANTASGTLTTMASALAPVSANLKQAAPDLNVALDQLPQTTKDLRGLLTPLSQVLDAAPATLDRVPALGTDVRNLVPGARSLLSDANPMLSYLKPYGPELAAFFANFNAVLQYTDEAGVHYARLLPHVNEQSVQSPLKSSLLGTYYNPLPAPGTGAHPGPYSGTYPRLEPEPK
ncbi:MlaD family protein [Amycolatopsis acidiphila]|uniref:MCE family protein n=1 Tax=Amycolatopsis acidiphila TaxID=715473 RepID=A0A557ZUZ5_9PSEU|nr:MlaD family protein [Amycolatopsis acidiphila]TVT15841.1 MCE family protein [Amycolatopsis acidiphila]UIJ57687.1 MlaD family protein [Amycolatopsis acidiphila]GHG95347.1 hypothetical protein GCM10017788_73700 [Amycolatopsis acidiphila]